MKNVSEGLSGDLVVDASVIIELAYASKLGGYFRKRLFDNKLNLSLTRLAITEVYYVLCRTLGEEAASQKLNTLTRSGVFHLDEPMELPVVAGLIKCQRKLSLADSYVIALAQLTRSKALFARREKEILAETIKKPFSIQILFLEDFVK